MVTSASTTVPIRVSRAPTVKFPVRVTSPLHVVLVTMEASEAPPGQAEPTQQKEEQQERWLDDACFLLVADAYQVSTSLSRSGPVRI